MRASALYPCISAQFTMYEYNRNENTPLYSDIMIYSPDVPIFRDDSGSLLVHPIVSSFITAPAVNNKIAKDRGILDSDIRYAMKNRVRKILELAYSKNPEAIILGAFGCGVFGNKPENVAKIFREELEYINLQVRKPTHIAIIFAIYDKDGSIINDFKREFNVRD